VTLVAAGGAAVVFRGKLIQAVTSVANKSTGPAAGVPPPSLHPVPTNTHWTLELTNALVPDDVVAGSIHGSGFLYERATLQGGNLTLRQGRTWPPDLGISIQFFAQQGEELSGKTIEIGPERTPPLPKVVLRWKNDQGHQQTHNLIAGYAMKISFGPAANGRIPGKIYLGIPDDEKSFVAGTFEAEIRKPPPPRPKPPAPAPPP
jgi:hypothetical protein